MSCECCFLGNISLLTGQHCTGLAVGIHNTTFTYSSWIIYRRPAYGTESSPGCPSGTLGDSFSQGLCVQEGEMIRVDALVSPSSAQTTPLCGNLLAGFFRKLPYFVLNTDRGSFDPGFGGCMFTQYISWNSGVFKGHVPRHLSIF